MRTLSAFVMIVIALALSDLQSGCRSSETTQNLSAEDRFERGKLRFADEDYLDAIEDFMAVTLQFPGSAVADDAQFYLGESRFRRGEYLLAAYEYETLKKNMPASPFLPLALYNIGLSYYKLAPNPPLDQQYTRKAIDEFQNFLEYYPTHELAPDAETKIQELNNRLAKKDYDTAVLYMKMEHYKAATFYFDRVLEKFHDSQYAEQAHVGKIESLVARKRFEEARIEIEKFRVRFPKSDLDRSIESLEFEVNKHLEGQSTTQRRAGSGGFARQP